MRALIMFGRDCIMVGVSTLLFLVGLWGVQAIISDVLEEGGDAVLIVLPISSYSVRIDNSPNSTKIPHVSAHFAALLSSYRMWGDAWPYGHRSHRTDGFIIGSELDHLARWSIRFCGSRIFHKCQACVIGMA